MISLSGVLSFAVVPFPVVAFTPSPSIDPFSVVVFVAFLLFLALNKSWNNSSMIWGVTWFLLLDK